MFGRAFREQAFSIFISLDITPRGLLIDNNPEARNDRLRTVLSQRNSNEKFAWISNPMPDSLIQSTHFDIFDQSS
jgi:hypothetical protein